MDHTFDGPNTMGLLLNKLTIQDAHSRHGLARRKTKQETGAHQVNDQSMTTTQATQKPRGAPTTYTVDDIELIEKSIASAPVPARPIGAADALLALAPVLRKARERGHTLIGLVQLCEAQGLHVNERSISRAISKSTTTKPAKKKQVASA
jgi:hypothetical protein